MSLKYSRTAVYDKIHPIISAHDKDSDKISGIMKIKLIEISLVNDSSESEYKKPSVYFDPSGSKYN